MCMSCIIKDANWSSIVLKRHSSKPCTSFKLFAKNLSYCNASDEVLSKRFINLQSN